MEEKEIKLKRRWEREARQNESEVQKKSKVGGKNNLKLIRIFVSLLAYPKCMQMMLQQPLPTFGNVCLPQAKLLDVEPHVSDN